MASWLRMRFYEPNCDDPRPITVPPSGPWWISGEAADGSYAVIVAYVKDGDDLKTWWPNAFNIEESGENPYDKPQFYDRFPCPDDWDEDQAEWET